MNLKPIIQLIHTILMLGTFAVASKFYDPTLLVGHEIPTILKLILLVGIIGVSFSWTLLHICGGGLMGILQGGIGEGMRMGLMLGVMLGIGRLWPYTLVWTLAALVFSKHPILNVTLGIILTAFCFALHRITSYIWSKVEAS